MVRVFLVAVIAGVIGFSAGYATGWHHRLNDPASAMRSQMREAVSSQNYATVLNLSVLMAIEKGDVEKTKSHLTRQVATYQHSWAEYDGVVPGLPTLLPVIRESVNHSPALREELGRKPE